MNKTIKIRCNIENGHLFTNGVFSFTMEWTLPFLPRIGERLHSSILTANIDPHSFYMELCEKYKGDWEEKVVRSGQGWHIATEKALEDWCNTMLPVVRDIHWCQGENGCFIEMFVKNII